MKKEFNFALVAPVYFYLCNVLNDDDFKKIDAFMGSEPSTDEFFKYVGEHHYELIKNDKHFKKHIQACTPEIHFMEIKDDKLVDVTEKKLSNRQLKKLRGAEKAAARAAAKKN